MIRLLQAAWRRPGVALALAGVVTLLALHALWDVRTGAPRLDLDPSLDRLLAQADGAGTDPSRVRSDGALAVGLAAPDVFTSARLLALRELDRELRGLAGVAAVRSLASAYDVRDRDGDLHVAPFLEAVPEQVAALAALRERALANPLVAGQLVSRGGDLAVLLVTLREGDAAAAREAHRAVLAAARAHEGPFAVHVTGKPHFDAALGDALARTVARLVPAAVLILAGVLWLAFRRPRGVLVPMTAMLAALLWTLGTGAALGFSLDLVTVTLPPLVLTLAFAYCMHVVSEHYAVAGRHDEPSPRLVRRALRAVRVPLVLTAITTMAGFLALATNPLDAIVGFGVLSALGVLYSLLAALWLCPAILSLLPPPRPLAAASPNARLVRLAGRLADFDFYNRRWIIALSLVLMAVAVAGATRIRVGMDYGEAFREGSAIRRDFETVNERMDGANPFYLVLESHGGRTFADPERLAELRALQAWLEAQPEVGGTVSVADYLMVLNRALHGDDPERFALPATRRLAHQLLLFGGSDDLDLLLDPGRREATVWVRTRVRDSAAVADLARRVERRLEVLPPDLEARVSGHLVAASRTVDAIARGQIESLLLATAVILAVLSALFTSLRVGLVALLPNLLIVFLYLGLLGFAGVPLNPTTSLIGCIALGIAVDDTIHYFARFNADAKRPVRRIPATKSALIAVLRPVTFTSLGLCLGFLTLTASEIRTQAEFGVLAAAALAAAWLVDVTLTPALACSTRMVTLWDVLNLDLGPDPTRTIPIFRGLSVREARIVALMGEWTERRPGTVLFKGEAPRDLVVVVVDGELSMYVEEWGARVRVARLQRGDVLEHGALSGRVPLEVETDDAVRLLLFGDAALESLRRRYPRIAAKVFRNLARGQAANLRAVLEWITSEPR